MATEAPSPDTTFDPSAVPTRMLRSRLTASTAWILEHQWGSLLILVLTTIVLAIPCTLYSLHKKSLTPNPDDTLSEALLLLDKYSLSQARDLATKLAKSQALAEAEIGGPAFVLGATAAYEAELHEDPQLFVPAAKYLTVAHELGFPAGREAQGLFLLGKSLFYSDARQESRPVLLDVLELDSTYHSETHRLLTRLHYFNSPPDLELALHHANEHLADNELLDEERDQGLLLLSQIQFDSGHYKDSSKTLQRMSNGDQVRAESLILQGRLSLREAHHLILANEQASREATKGLIRDALNLFRQVYDSRSVPSQSTRRSAYLIGVAYQQLEDYRAAEKQFHRTARSYFETDEAVAATLGKADMLRQMEQHDNAVKAYGRALQLAGPSETYENLWLPLDTFMSQIRTAYDAYLTKRNFAQAVSLAESLSPTLATDQAFTLLAEAQEAWVNYLMETGTSPSKEVQHQQQLAALHRDLGSTYEKLARSQFATREYPYHTLRSAQEYLEGSNFTAAIRQYQEFLKGEPTARRATALIGLGRSLLALNRIEQALEPFQECIEFHTKDPAVYTARLLGADAYLRLNKYQQARALLEDNLYHGELTPRSNEWRDSLFMLGRIDYEESNSAAMQTNLQAIDRGNREEFKEKINQLELNQEGLRRAIRYLQEAVERYPRSPQTVQARYSLGESYRLSATLPKAKSSMVAILTTRQALQLEALANLERALEVYTSLIHELTAEQEERELNRLEQTIQRNCYFARGFVLDGMGRCQEAIDAFEDATSRYQRRPETMEAFVEIASCYRQLERPLDARKILAEAKDLLDRMDEQTDFRKTTRFSREEWTEYLNWLVTL